MKHEDWMPTLLHGMAPVMPAQPSNGAPDEGTPEYAELRGCLMILSTICEAHHITLGEMYSNRKTPHITHARAQAYYELAKTGSYSWGEIARITGKDRAACLKQARVHAKRIGVGNE